MMTTMMMTEPVWGWTVTLWWVTLTGDVWNTRHRAVSSEKLFNHIALFAIHAPALAVQHTRNPVWVQDHLRNHRHDLHCDSIKGHMIGTECRLSHNSR